MEDGIERELQFGCADVEPVAAWLGRQPAHAALRFVAEGDKTQRDTYFDTEGWALLRGGFSLRVRRKGEAAEATLKATTKRAAGPQMRREISQKVESEAALGDGEGPVGSRVRLMAAGWALEPLFEIETRRRAFGVLQGSERVAEISLDETLVLRAAVAGPRHEGAALAPSEDDPAPTLERAGFGRGDEGAEAAPGDDASTPTLERAGNGRGDEAAAAVGSTEREALRAFRRVEIEETAPGGLGLCATFIEAMTLECGLVFAETSKFEEGLEAAGLEPGAALDFGSTTLEGDASAAAYAFALLRQYWRDFLKREPGTRLGEDPEELHDMRVAARRMRSAMSTFRPVLPDDAERLREELGWAGRSLGHVRDLDVQIEWLESVRAESDWQAANALGPLIEELLRRRETARTELLLTMGSERFDGLVTEMSGFFRAGAPEDGGGPAIRPFARKVLRKRYRQFRRDGESIEAESEAALYHAARIRAKRLRYAAAGFAELYGEPAIALVESVKAVQDLLGEHQDCAVTVDWLGRIASEHSDWPPATYVRIGELMERQRGRMAQIRQEWPEAFGTVRKAWRPLRRQFKQPKAAVVVEEEPQTEPEDPEEEPEDPEEEPSGIEPVSVVPTPEHRTRLRALLGYLRRRR